MVQTRSKYRLLQHNIAVATAEPHQQSFNSSESEDETFDNNLHLEQQKLIDVYNREDNEEENLELNDLNIGATATEINLSQSPYSWTNEKDDLKWTTTNKNKDCSVMGNFSYISMKFRNILTK